MYARAARRVFTNQWCPARSVVVAFTCLSLTILRRKMEMMPTSQLALLSDRISSLRQKSKILSGNSLPFRSDFGGATNQQMAACTTVLSSPYVSQGIFVYLALRFLGGRVNHFPSNARRPDRVSREFLNHLIIKLTRGDAGTLDLVGSFFDGNTDRRVSWDGKWYALIDDSNLFEDNFHHCLMTRRC